MSFRLTCPYCARPAERVTGRVVYPHRPDLAYRVFYQCEPCDARVGTHARTGKPLGTMADFATRAARSAAHAAFDPLWRDGHMNRTEAYAWLAGQLGMSAEDCHIARMNTVDCQRVVAAMANKQKESA